VFGAGIRTDAKSSHIIIEGVTGRYLSHSWSRDLSRIAGVLVSGSNVDVLNCDFGFSSSSVLSVSGRDHRIINCRLHHGGYAGLWRGTVALAGRRILFSHNTVRHAGRDLINTHGLMESLVQFNDVSEAGWLTSDLGMFYGHNTDFANTRFHHNLVHDNHAAHCSMGIYFDHLSHNAIVDYNVVWNVGRDPIRFNNPSYCNLVFNNSCWRSGEVGTFDHSKRNDLFASRYTRNIFNRPAKLPAHVVIKGNLIDASPPFRDPGGGDFRLREGAATNAGACPDGRRWRAGCDLDHPPEPLPVYRAPRVPWMNAVKNACFEFGTLEGWTETSPGHAALTPGNGWGNTVSSGAAEKRNRPTGTSKHELRLGPRGGVSQQITGLIPATTYTLSAWLRVSAPEESVVLGVRGHGMPERSTASAATEWERRSIEFTTGRNSKSAEIFLARPPAAAGQAWCDNLTLPLASS